MAAETHILESTPAVTTAEFEQLYGQLNREQKRAVDTIEGPVMVVAGPGTGKTQVLTMRIAKILLETQMDPQNILCLTFTESGVAAMRQRLVSIIGTPAYYVHIHTFHSFCNEIIQEHPEYFAWTRNLRVVADIDKAMIFREIMEGLSARNPLKPFGNPYLYFRDVTGNIQDLKQEDISPEEFKETLEALEALIELAEVDVNEFLTLTPKERTADRCAQIHDVVAAAVKKAKVPDSMQALVTHLFSNYEKTLMDAEGVREQSKARTAYKNELKKWWLALVKYLPKQKEMAFVYEKYQALLKERGQYDYEDMIMMVVKELKQNNELLLTYQEQFQYVLVDEYQDTNGAQNDVVNLLTSFGEQPNVFVVGDDKQSIYRFQGASLANMLQFYERFKADVEVVTLKQNYRSQQTVLDAATSLISYNQESLAAYIPGVTQELVAATPRRKENVGQHVFASQEAEDYFVAKNIQGLVESGVDPKEIAVLYRYNKDGQDLLRLLQRLGVSARLEIGQNILDTHLVRQWITLFSWLIKGDGDELLANILQYAWWHLPAVDVLRAIHYAGSRYTSLYGVIADKRQLEKAGVTDKEALMAFAEKVAMWRSDATNEPLQQFLEKLLVESHFLDDVIKNHEQAEVLREITALLQEAKELNMAHHEYTLADFVNHLQLLKEHEVALMLEPWRSKENAVHLMSAHKAKGLEFEHVFVTRLNDKHWGNERNLNKAPLPQGLVKYDYVIADTNEDERRLFYVALTRAKQKLVLTRAAHSDSGSETVPSLFLQEIPAENVTLQVHEESEDETTARLAEALLTPVPKFTTDDVQRYIRSLLDGYVMSVTDLNNYLECPRKFYFRNLLSIPMAKTKSLAMGTAVHGALYDLFEQLKEKGSVMTKAQFLAAFDTHMRYELLRAVDAKDALEQGRHILAKYYERYSKEFHPAELLEYDFASHHVRIGDIPITGKIDKVEVIDKSRKLVNVVDYKTGKVENALAKLREGQDYRRQIIFYQLLCDTSKRFPYTMESGEVDFVEEDAKGKHLKKKIVVRQEELDELKETITRVWAEIHELKFLEADGGCGKADCEWCVSK